MTGSRQTVENALIEWIAERSDKAVEPTTPLLSQKIINSLDVTDLLLRIEELRGQPIDVTALKPGVFSDVNTIVSTFFSEVDDV